MNILGLMSGTSLDGVDLALCSIDGTGYRVLAADTVPYPAAWRQRLATLEQASALEYAQANVDLGHYLGATAHRFLRQHADLPCEAVASHGHTIFHQPTLGLTAQIGDGDAIAAETGLPVVSNFRTLDVALGGQGAPLVPVGDELFFGRYDACLNLGGIANISYRDQGRRVAFDICPCNMVLNRMAAMLGMDYDPDGRTARQGTPDGHLLQQMEGLDYYRQAPPKSLGKEWFVEHFWPLPAATDLPVADLLATATRHIALRIAAVLHGRHIGSLLVTGGGAWNRYLIESLHGLAPEVEITVPDALTVNYKEAIIFALLGYLRLGGRVNTQASVTGARCDSIGGTLSGLLPPLG